jgi:hypothetical protein
MPGAGTCKFAGTVSGSPPTAIAGDIECSSGWTGTWQATRGAPAASLPPGLVAIDVADMAACATAADGRVACWGPNQLGQLGSGDDVPRIVPGPSVDGYAFRKVSISTSGGHANSVSMRLSTSSRCARSCAPSSGVPSSDSRRPGRH